MTRKPALQPEMLAELRDAGERRGVDFTRPIVNLFRRDAPARVEQLIRAAESGDKAATDKAAQALRGSASQIGAHRLAAFGRYVETRPAGSATQALRRFRPSLEIEMNRVLAELPSVFDEVLPTRATRVLIADEEPHISLFLSSVLSAEGYTTIEAATEAAILDCVAFFHPDVLLLDWSHDGATAAAVMTGLARMKDHPAVVVLSSRAEEPFPPEVMERHGFLAALPKPIGPRALVRALNDAGFGALVC